MEGVAGERAARHPELYQRVGSERQQRPLFNLMDLDALFAELIAHPLPDAVVRRLLGDDYMVSNFTANIARPGSRSMVVQLLDRDRDA